MSKPAAAVGGSIVTLRPNETVDANLNPGSPPNAWTPSTGTIHGVTSDDSDATYAYVFSGSGEGELGEPGSLVLGFGTHSFSGVASIDSVTMWIRLRRGSSGGTLDFASRVGTTNNAFNTATPTGSFALFTGTARTAKPGGGAWDQTAIDGLRCILTPFLGYDFGDWVLLAEVGADVAYTP